MSAPGAAVKEINNPTGPYSSRPSETDRGASPKLQRMRSAIARLR